MKSMADKSKTEEAEVRRTEQNRTRVFQEQQSDKWCFVEIKNSITCVMCKQRVSLLK